MPQRPNVDHHAQRDLNPKDEFVLWDRQDRARLITADELFKREPGNVQLVREQADLPPPKNGRHPLSGGTAYLFDGYVTSPYGLELGDPATPLFSHHGGIGGFIHTGGSDAVYGDGAHFFARDMLISAPGGSALNITGTTSEEILVESASIADPAGLGNMTSLGTIDGFRVPTFKGCNFEDFDGGITLTGTSSKVFFSGCPIRTVSASGVTILHFDSGFETDIVDIVDCYAKGLQSDTEVVRVDPAATINDVFQYRGVTHDTTVTMSNILTGAAGIKQVGYRVANSYPLRDSSIVAELNLDAETTTTITSQNSWNIIEGSASLGSETERMSNPSIATLQYDGKKDASIKVDLRGSFEGASNEIYEVAFFKNGTLQAQSTAEVEAAGANKPRTVATQAVEQMSTGDTLSARVQNVSGTGDATLRNYVITAVQA